MSFAAQRSLGCASHRYCWIFDAIMISKYGFIYRNFFVFCLCISISFQIVVFRRPHMVALLLSPLPSCGDASYQLHACYTRCTTIMAHVNFTIIIICGGSLLHPLTLCLSHWAHTHTHTHDMYATMCQMHAIPIRYVSNNRWIFMIIARLFYLVFRLFFFSDCFSCLQQLLDFISLSFRCFVFSRMKNPMKCIRARARASQKESLWIFDSDIMGSSCESP